MIFSHDAIYGKVWKIEKHDKYYDLQMTTSEKGLDGQYINSGWFPRVIGHALNTLKDIQPGDRIKITKSKFTNERYTASDGSTKSSFKFLVLEASIETTAGTTSAPSDDNTTATAPTQPVTTESDPW